MSCVGCVSEHDRCCFVSGTIKNGRMVKCNDHLARDEYYTYAELMDMHKSVWDGMYRQIVIHGLSYLKKVNNDLVDFKKGIFNNLFSHSEDSSCFGCINCDSNCVDCFLNLACDEKPSLYRKSKMAYHTLDIKVLDYIKQIRDCGFAEGIDKNSFSNVKKSDISIK